MTGTPAQRDCAVFVTHIWSQEISDHYARLKREAGVVVDVFLVYQQRVEETVLPHGVAPDLIVRMRDKARYFPLRYEEHLTSTDPTAYVDLVWMTAFLDPLLAAYDRFWLIEYDVDFSGDWATFFNAAGTYDGDLLSTHIHPLSAEPTFGFAPAHRQPASIDLDPLIAFMPISRLSRPLVEHYQQILLQPGWHGHFEMVVPSIAQAYGFSIAEIGGHEDLTPPERRGLHYEGKFSELHLLWTTHGFRPPRGFKYYGSVPHKFPRKDRIYHPIKTGLSLRQRLHMRYLRPLQKVRAFSRWLRGKA